MLKLLLAYPDKAIARRLHLSYDGVRSRVRAIFRKLGANNRVDAVYRARAEGILRHGEDSVEG